MTAKTVCDNCDKTIIGKPLITSTEEDGQVFDFDKVDCYLTWRKTRP